MYPHTSACPVCWCLVFKNNFFNYFFPIVQLVWTFGGFSLKNKKRWKVVLGHVFALNPASIGGGVSWSFPKQLLSACWDPLLGFFFQSSDDAKGKGTSADKSSQFWVFTKLPCPRCQSTWWHFFIVLLVFLQSTGDHKQMMDKNESSSSVRMVWKVKGKAAPSRPRAHTDAFTFLWTHFQGAVIVDVLGRSDGERDNAPECKRICPRVFGPLDSLQLESY